MDAVKNFPLRAIYYSRPFFKKMIHVRAHRQTISGEPLKLVSEKLFIYSIVHASFQVTEVFVNQDMAKNVKFSSHEALSPKKTLINRPQA